MSTITPPTAYSLLLPPGWVRVPLRNGTRAVLDARIFRGIERIPAGVPRDKGMAYRLYVRRRVEGLVAEARKAGGLDLYVPVGARPGGGMLAASFVVAEVAEVEGVEGVEGEAAQPEAVLGRLAGEAGEVRGVAETVGVRREYVRAAAEEEAEAGVPTRHVDYVVPVPGDGGRWLTVSFSTAGDGDPASPFTRAVAELFDAMMTTFRWGHSSRRTP
ncbi:hypothetical protein GA0115240_163537 [Streptomyces sp. DvalAA-14]|uniref:hypothetical protein n=1 Tax=unclassified Streptomyces TaxID=2593676 RepID=UPI00081B70F6|nr:MULTISPECIES: hypothetical protein [unclassified Streptomyces]MYS24363.1 hypothetical protein [Streptomyces sp. SID4948]SCE45303.1 hypothetical protein GA0115240_163537 [Streptomyces sp. DvalAA-14]